MVKKSRGFIKLPRNATSSHIYLLGHLLCIQADKQMKKMIMKKMSNLTYFEQQISIIFHKKNVNVFI